MNLSKSNKIFENAAINIEETQNATPYKATTNDIEITVWPEFIDGKISALGGLFVWTYHIRIENRSNNDVTLLNRHWKIVDEHGSIQEVDGAGVVGEQPKIKAGNAFQYSSGVHLRYPSGIMSGHYQLQKDTGELFNVDIPAFSLDVPEIKTVVN